MPVILLLIMLLAATTDAFADGCRYWSGETYTPPVVNGPTYYVDGTNGSDSYTTTQAQNSATPWKTIAKAFDRYTNRTAAGTGLRVLVKTGAYYEKISIPDSSHWTPGTTDATRIVLAPYGDGEVILDGSLSNKLSAWSVYSGNIYQSAFTAAPVGGLRAIVIDDEFRSYRPATSVADITAPGMWFFDATVGTYGTLYVWTANGSSPSGSTVLPIETDVSNSSKYGITIQTGQNYVTIGGLTIRGYPGHNIFMPGTAPYNSNITIEYNKIQYSNYAGIWAPKLTNGKISKNHVTGNVMRNWPRGSWATTCGDYSAGGWPPSLAIISNLNSVVSGNIVSWSHGEGLIFLDNGAAYGGNIAENNIVENAYSTGMYFDHGHNSTIRNNFIFSSEPLDTDIRVTGCSAAERTALKRKSRPPALQTANEAGDGLYLGNGNSAYNNIAFGTNIGMGNGDETLSGSGVVNETWVNNTVVLPPQDPSVVNDQWIGARFGYNSGHNSGSIFKNNLIISPHVSGLATTASATGIDTGITWDNNMYYAAGSAQFVYGGSGYSFDGWKTASGQDAHSVHSDPILARTDWSLVPTKPTSQAGSCRTVYDQVGVNISDFMPQSNSPARAMGADLSAFIATDFNGYQKAVPMTVGALDFGSAYTEPQTAIPGLCGSSNGLALSTAPTVGLCAAGTPSAVIGTGPWSWTCAGSGGGSTASCGATMLETPPTGNASALVACPVIAGFR